MIILINQIKLSICLIQNTVLLNFRILSLKMENSKQNKQRNHQTGFSQEHPHDNSKSTTHNSNEDGKTCFFLGDTETGKKILQIIDGIPYSIFITIVTIITLFADDFRQIFFEKDADLSFSIITLICMAIYTIEMVALCLLKEGYFLKYYFWLDLISTATMILDLMWISQLLNGGNGVEAAASVAKVARASRASKIGAKSTRLIRILRLIRLLKLMKNAQQKFNQRQQKKQQEADNLHKQQVVQYKRRRINKVSTQTFNQADRKVSKRMERIREASCSVIKSEKNHQISLNCIEKAGSTRKIQIGKPLYRNHSGNLPAIQQMQMYEAKEGKRNIPISLKNMKNEPKVSMVIPQQKVDEMKVDYKVDGNIAQVKQNSKQAEFSNGQRCSGQPENNDHNSNDNHQPNEQHSEYQSNKKIAESQKNLYDIPKQTKVGSKLKDEIQKNIISMILLILISIPIFSSSTWFDLISTYDKSIEQLAFFKGAPMQFDIQANLFITEMLKLPQPLVFFQVQVNTTCCQFPRDYPAFNENVPDITSLRADSISAVIDQASNAVVIYDLTQLNILAAQLSIGRTLFVCLLLVISTLLFSRDIEMHALEPLENMIRTVKNISNDPIHAIREIQQNKILEKEEFSGQVEKKHRTEPIILEEMIIKISELLIIGLGEAGTELIAKNIENHGSLNVMMPGKKIMGIFGFCDIRNFTDATQVLQAQVMVFVNQIAQICHDVVNRNGGNPNKNIGDAFLLVWKFGQQDTVLIQGEGSEDLTLKLKQTSIKAQQTADLAVFSFAKMIAQIAKSHALQKYKNHNGLKDRIKDYQGVKMGFGLHVGWAIEGPIGSQFKIDASYLSPNVNMASRLQAATKQYGIPILITGEIYDLMVTKNKEYLRHIDRVIAKGTDKPFDLYTLDLSVENILKVFGVSAKKDMSLNDRQKVKVSHNKIRQLRLSRIQKHYFTPQLWRQDKDVKCMREPYSKMFFGEFKKGMQNYIGGKWKEAIQLFKKTEIMAPGHSDGPSAALIKFMEETDGKAPSNWNGYREFNQ